MCRRPGCRLTSALAEFASTPLFQTGCFLLRQTLHLGPPVAVRRGRNPHKAPNSQHTRTSTGLLPLVEGCEANALALAEFRDRHRDVGVSIAVWHWLTSHRVVARNYIPGDLAAGGDKPRKTAGVTRRKLAPVFAAPGKAAAKPRG
jgi:hypothetical protein